MWQRVLIVILSLIVFAIGCSKANTELTPDQEAVLLGLIMKETGRKLPKNVSESCQWVTTEFLKKYSSEKFECMGMEVVKEDGFEVLEVRMVFNGKAITYDL
jgi:hypothetical protein